ncbi:MAG: RnfABCDGE type electron transport complex subunit G [Firmicutes bacterium]|nr:RnfABCDGE type electron transport complex subunit G [Lachnospiraceae bacterium]MDD6066748.1 RnfABCDGE type electron transport complex subunit G [Bacillota bacterium]MDY2819868.1 RnfABCDGE type electron transport complex subunit G [Hominisplanchenecus sp.]
MNKIIKNALILMAITLVAGLLLGTVYGITKEPIAQAEAKAEQEAYLAVFPGAEEFVEPEQKDELLAAAADALTAAGYDSTADTIENFYLVNNGGQIAGVVINLTSHEGYGGDINFSMGIDLEGTVKGVEILSISETAGLGMHATEDSFKGQFRDKAVDQFVVTKTGAAAENEIDAISGATFTSKAMTNGVNAGICFYQSLVEGGVLNE